MHGPYREYVSFRDVQPLACHGWRAEQEQERLYTRFTTRTSYNADIYMGLTAAH